MLKNKEKQNVLYQRNNGIPWFLLNALTMIFYVYKLTVPHNRIDQTSLKINIHLIVHGIEKRQKEAILKYTDLTNV